MHEPECRQPRTETLPERTNPQPESPMLFLGVSIYQVVFSQWAKYLLICAYCLGKRNCVDTELGLD